MATTAPTAPTAHVDTFARDRLPPREQWPDLPFDRPELAYPERLNAAAALLDPWLARGWAPRPCFITPTGTWSWGDLAATVDRIAAHLVEERGLVPGNRVLLRGPNTPMLAACWLAVAKAGCIVVATMPLLRAAELSHILEKAQVDLALCDAAFLDDLTGARAAVGQDFPVVAFNAPAATEGLEALIAGRPTGFAAVDTAADDICLIAFTSGTTGRPKATAHFHRDMLAVADLSPRTQLNATPDDVFCGSPSIAFAYGLGGLMLFPLRAGACAVLIDRPTPERVLDAIARHKGTICFTVPTVYRSMSALIAAGGAPDTASLRACVSAGEPLTPSTFDDWKQLTGLDILDTLGTTELLNAVLASPPDAVRQKRGFTDDERAQIETSRYRCFLLGLPEELLPTDPEGLVRVFLGRAATLRKGFDDDTCGALVRATMAAYLRPDRSLPNRVGEIIERSFSTAFFVKAFLNGDRERAAEMGVELTPADVALVSLTAPFILGRAKTVELLERVPPLRPAVDAYVTWMLRQRLRSYGHPEFRTDASSYRQTEHQSPAEPAAV